MAWRSLFLFLYICILGTVTICLTDAVLYVCDSLLNQYLIVTVCIVRTRRMNIVLSREYSILK